MRKYKNKLVGNKYGKLNILEDVGNNRHFAVCDCGTFKLVNSQRVYSGRLKSCGCLIRETARETKSKHSQSNTKIYTVWDSMIQRCKNPLAANYRNYGGRGITVCDRWLNSFENFYEDMGTVPEGMSLERKNNSLGYFKENCKWATNSEQGFNQRRRCTNTSGRTGVSWDARRESWRVGITKDKITIHIGYFKSFEEACCIRTKAEIEYYGFTKE